jgi:serine/threonine-protein kinase
MLLTSGASFARYKVEASLGDGGMGHVYKAFDTQLHRRVALKLLNTPHEDGGPIAQAAALLLREARAAAALNHPHAVTVFEVGEHDGVPFMAMELIDGRPLRHLIGRTDISLLRRLRWLLGIANALAAAHAAGIVHLDVKPENVIVRDDDVAKVLDFGIARRRSFDPELAYPIRQDAERIHNLTGGGSIAGTPRYMAPEQIGRLDLDGRTDQFAWGVVAYELLTGRSPWPAGDDLYSLFAAIVRTPATPIHRLRGEVPEALSNVVTRAMSKMRDDRFPSMAMLAAALQTVMDELPAAARGPMSAGSLRPFQPASAAEARTLRAEQSDATLGDATLEVASTGPKGDLRSTPLSLRPSSPAGRNDSEQISLPGLSSVKDAARRAMSGEGDTAPLPGAHADRETPAPGSGSGAPITQRSGTVALRPAARSFRATAGVLALALVGVGTWFAATHARGPVAPPVPPNAPACNEAATQAYASGSRALRSGNWNEAHKGFTAATFVDPECAPAYARLVVIGYWMDQPSKTRDAMRRALELRGRLSTRDQGLLECYEHVLWSTPPDGRAFATCVEKLSNDAPKDAELAYIASDFAATPARQRELAQRALDIDPEYSDAWQGLAVAFESEDNEVAALETLDSCVSHVTTSGDCFSQRALLVRRMGRCEDLESTARGWIARSPDEDGPYYTLGVALAARGQPRAAVEEALAPRWARLKGTEVELLDRAALAVLAGDFASAAALARDLETLAKSSPDVEPRVDAALRRLELGIETDQLEETGKLAEDLWSRKNAWDLGARRVGFNMRVLELDPVLLRVLRLTKRLPDSEWSPARARWIADKKAAGALSEEALWVLGQALQAETPEEATEAMKTMPPSILTTLTWTTKVPGLLTYAYAGRALLLAGRTDDALRLLRRAAASCSALDEPMLHTRAHAWLAEALEKKGDKPGACAALAVVTKRWDPNLSRTARLAADKAKSLACAR